MIQSEMENEVQKLLGKQFLITAYIQPRLQIVNFIKDGYDSNIPVLMNNRFLHFTAHNYYRSIIVDLAALFTDKTTTHKNNFYRLTKDEAAILSLKPGTIVNIKNWLLEVKDEISIIRALRDKEIAHFDFDEKESISLNFDNRHIINTLFNLAEKIIAYSGKSFINEKFSITYDFERESQYIRSLKGLITKN
jgi:hypothetical protein